MPFEGNQVKQVEALCSVPRLAPQTSTNNIQNSESGHVNLAVNANDVDSIDQEADDPFVDSRAQSRKGRKTTEFWEVKIIDNPAILSMREAIERPNGRKIVLRFNNAKQAIGDEAGLLSGVLSLLGSYYGKFFICEESWHKMTTKDKQISHFDEDSEGTIKKNILKIMGKSWKEIRLRLYNACFEQTFTTKQNIERRLSGIDREHWRWFLDYRAKAETKERIEEMEQQDESSRVLSQNDSIAQVFEKEKPGRVRGMGFGPTSSKLFGPNLQAPGNKVQLGETQRKLLELQADQESEKLKRKAMEDKAAEKKKM
ncbi:hypothetical protein Ahy_A04g020838 [Arachis hypogaea]|uniref:Uncharacterized protein n=1 Tax=Arachis hypogaea TaxID=3818 RepID=A0A445DIM8_ARAHY|nr:hypothetical protein Ahy_A04g020838 [Arachis hypogaea]